MVEGGYTMPEASRCGDGAASLHFFSNIGSRFGMALQIPAGQETIVREQGVHAGLQLGRIKDEFGLTAFLLNGVVAVYGDLTERLAVCGDVIAEHNEVRGIADQRNTQHEREAKDDRPFYKLLDSVSQR
jgi:hypothetical protein